MKINETVTEINNNIIILKHIGPNNPEYPLIYSKTQELLDYISVITKELN